MEHSELAVIGPSIGFRETRKLVGKETITVDDVISGRKRPDGVALGRMETGDPQGCQQNGDLYGSEVGKLF